jgi:hypothetical protein
MEDVFWANDEFVSSQGGILLEDDLTELEQLNWDILKELMGRAINKLNQTDLASELIGLNIHLINSSDINAFVRVIEERKIIGLCRGLICQLWNLLVNVISHGSVLAEHFLDSPKIDEVEWQQFMQVQFLSLRNKEYTTPHIPNYITTDRLELTTQLYCCICDYIVYHELAHLVRDHPGFLKSQFSLSSIEEKQKKKYSSDVLHTLNMLEIDADLHGLDMQLRDDSELSDLKLKPISHRRRHLFMYLFPQLLVSQMFDIEHTPISKQLEQIHPPPVYRSIIYTLGLTDTYEDIADLSKEDTKDEHDKAWWEASVCAKLLNFPNGRWLGENMNDINFEVVNKIIRQYKEFEEILNDRNTIG